MAPTDYIVVMSDSRPNWRVSFLGTTVSVRDATLRFLLRRRLFTGVELVRCESDGTWQPLHETQLFAEEIPNTGDAAVVAHRRKLRRWLIPGLSMMAWIGLMGGILIAESPGPGDFIPIFTLFVAMPSAALLLWTARFRESISIGLMGANQSVPDAANEPAQLPDLDFVPQVDLDALRAELEIIRDCEPSDNDPRIAIAEQAISAIEAYRQP